nr:hypothetical protein [Tanacetum cinerariifolium]
MSSLFADTHHVVAILEKSDAAEGFEQIINFLSGSYIHYALTVNPHIYISCIKQFWNTASVKRSDDVTRLQALVDRKNIVILEDVIREILQLDDAEGVNQVGDLSTHTTRFISPALTQKVFANMIRVGKGFSGVETPLFKGMLAARQLVDEGIAEEQVQADDDVAAAVQENVAKDVADDAIPSPPSHEIPSPSHEQSSPPQQPHSSPQAPPQGAEFPTHIHQVLDVCSALTRRVENLEHDKAAQKLEIIKLKARVKRLEKANKVKSSKLRRLRKVRASRRIESSDDMEDVFNQGRMIDDLDKDEGIELVVDQVKDANIAETEGRHAVEQAKNSAASATISAAKLSIPAAAPTVVTAYTRRRKGVIIRDPEEELSSKSPAETPKLKDKGKGMSYDEIRPIFQARFDANMRFLLKSREEMEEEDQEVLKSINETPAQKAAKRRKLNKEAQEVEDLKKHLEIVNDEDDDVVPSGLESLKRMLHVLYILSVGYLTTQQMGSYLKYALTMNPNIYVSCIKQFWNIVAIKQVNDVTRLQTLVDKKKVVVTDAVIRAVLWLDDAEGVDCLPNKEIFIELARMGYEKPSTKLTFYKAFFLSQWNLVRNVDSTTKFYMYPHFLQLLIRKQVGDLSTHSTKYASPTLTHKVFTNMRRVRKGFSRVETPLFERMLIGQEIEEEGDADAHDEDVTAGDDAHREVPAKVGTSQRVDTSDDTVIDDESNQGRMINEIDKDDVVVLMDENEEDKKVEEAKVDESAQVQGRQAESQAKIYKIDMDHASKVLIAAASAIISTAKPQVTTATITAAAAPSRRRKRVVIKDPKEESTTSSIISTETKSKDKGKRIMIEEPKPLEKKQQIEMDEEYARNCTKISSYKEKATDRSSSLKEHDDVLKEYIAFLLKTKEQIKETINETIAEKAAKRRKLNKEVEDLERHLEIMPDEDDDVYTEATPLARKVPVMDYGIIELNNKPYYKIIRADGTHQLYISFLTLLKNFDREDLEALWSLVKERFSTSKPKNFSDDFLLTTLRAMFEKPYALA